MPLPYSADLRERVRLAHEHGEGNAAVLAARFRVAVKTVTNWVRAAATAERRVAKPWAAVRPASGHAGVRGAAALGGG